MNYLEGHFYFWLYYIVWNISVPGHEAKMRLFHWHEAGVPSQPSPTEMELQCDVLGNGHSTRETMLINDQSGCLKYQKENQVVLSIQRCRAEVAACLEWIQKFIAKIVWARESPWGSRAQVERRGPRNCCSSGPSAWFHQKHFRFSLPDHS